MKSIEYGIRSPKGDFDRRPVKGSGSVSYVKGAMGNSKTSGAMQKKSIGLTGSSQGKGKNSFGKPGAQKYDHLA